MGSTVPDPIEFILGGIDNIPVQVLRFTPGNDGEISLLKIIILRK